MNQYYGEYTIYIPTDTKHANDQRQTARLLEGAARAHFPGIRVVHFDENNPSHPADKIWVSGSGELAAKILTTVWRLKGALQRLAFECEFRTRLDGSIRVESDADKALFLGIGNYMPGTFLTRRAEPLLGPRPDDDYVELFPDRSAIVFGSGQAVALCLECAWSGLKDPERRQWGVMEWPHRITPEEWATRGEAAAALERFIAATPESIEHGDERYGVYFDQRNWHCCLRRPLHPEHFDSAEEAYAFCFILYQQPGWLDQMGPLMPYPVDDTEPFTIE